MPKTNSEIATLTDNIRRLARTHVKAADVGGDQDQPFEQAFSNIAHAYLKDKAPTLLDYEVGFQMLDRNQENTKAVGVFGFKVGPQWLYAPVFFLNGDLKGHELLYVKHQDMFVPLKENWINYLLNRKPSILGTEVSRNLSTIGVMPPHLYQLSRSPSKFASVVERLSPWMKEALPTIAHLAVSNPAKDKKYDTVTDLPTFLNKEGKAVIKSLILGFKENPKLATTFEQFHDLSVIDEAIKEANVREVLENTHSVLKRDIKKRRFIPRVTPSVISSPESNEVNTEPGDLLKCSELGYPMDKGISYAQQHKLKIYTYDDILQHGTGLEDLNDKERSKLMKDRVLVKDDRNDDEVVRAYEVTSTVKIQNPTETGLYDLLVKPSKFEKCLVILSPYTNHGREDFATVVNLDKKEKGYSWLNIHPSHLWVGNQYKIEDFQDWWNKLPEADSLPVSKTRKNIFIGNTGEGSAPFRVRKEISSDSRKMYDVRFDDYASRHRSGNLPSLARNDTYDYFSNDSGDRVVLTGKRGAKLRSVGSDLYVPTDYRVLELRPDVDDKKNKKNDSIMYECCGGESDPPAVVPGNQLDIELLLGTKTASVKIYSTGTEIEINGKRMQKLASLIHLVRDWRMRESTARILLKRADEKKVARFRVKKADQYYDLQHNFPTTPGIPETPIGYDPVTGGKVPTQNLGEWNLKIPDMSASKTDRMIYHPVGPEPILGVGGTPAGPDRGAQQAALQAAQTGQKEIFDTAMIGSLLKSVRDDSMVDRYMGDLMKGLDRLGRILFLFYWHNEKFADRYGKNEMTELEDGIRNAFEYLGDISLFLKQRSVEADPQAMHGVNLSEISS
jgi:hypothetical protein